MIVYQGEIRNIGLTISNSKIDSFVIDSAQFAISDPNENISIHGDATINGNSIYTLFSADNIGKYNVTFIYKIGPEILKAKLYIDVVQ